VRVGCIGSGSCKGQQEAWASRIGLSFAFAAAGPCRTGAGGPGCRWQTGGSQSWGSFRGKTRTARWRTGGSRWRAGGISDGSTEMKLGSTGGGGLGELLVGMAVRGTLRAEAGLALFHRRNLLTS
jgi:hypothetical protein